MNQVYQMPASAIVVEPGDEAPNFDHIDPVKELKISTSPGLHLPHVWLAADGQSERVSILDLCGPGQFTLFTGIGGDSWLEAAADLNKTTGFGIRGYKVGFACDYLDCYSDWFRVRGVKEAGVVLVRPDHFVAWRCPDLVADARSKLASVLQRLLLRRPET